MAVSLSPCPRSLFLDSMSSNIRRKRELYSEKLRLAIVLNTSFLDSITGKRQLSSCSRNGLSSRKRNGKLIVVNELGGQYEDTFNDVKLEIINYFTFKAVRTVLEQLYEMNPPQYIWFYSFVSTNSESKDWKRLLQILVKENQELAERVMITRLSLYGRWSKKCDHGEIYKEISEENLKLMRDRLLETIIWPSDDIPSSQDPNI
ncbi:chaperonin-like RbcX protein 2, chloroplastic [Primulina huaijiensis]|uniref:chaperonin-like RbcX protein 2, chloroplastic n=1 Tax=Primulina huaijiensis TaxID=1492673 RepID=UPI003CC708A9